MDLGLGGKTALVTAASKGLGRAIATELAREGARVVISSRDEQALARTAAEIGSETGAEVGYRAADLTSGDEIEALVRHALDRFGGIDVLPSMRERGEGRIVNVASSSVKQPIDNLLLSNTFRAGLAGLAKSLSLELAPDNILVNTLGPGRILTGRTETVDAGQAESQGVSVEEVREQFASRIPLGRYGTPEEFARVAAFLASPANGYVTGQAVLVDGGMVRRSEARRPWAVPLRRFV